jgi:hypothetical protein
MTFFAYLIILIILFRAFFFLPLAGRPTKLKGQPEPVQPPKSALLTNFWVNGQPAS